MSSIDAANARRTEVECVKSDHANIQTRLARHYATHRTNVEPQTLDDLVTAMLSEDARTTKARTCDLGLATFVAAQVRFIPTRTWAAQTALVALMFLLAHVGAGATATKVAVGVLSATTVLVGMPTVQASKQHGMAELEYACPHNAASVMVARLIILGCSSSLAVAIMVGAAASSLDVSAFSVALWTCPPLFCSCAGSLAILRKTAPSTAAALCAVWTLACSATLAAAALAIPTIYADAALATWAIAATAALAWLIRELTATIRAATAGLDAFSPHLSQTYE